MGNRPLHVDASATYFGDTADKRAPVPYKLSPNCEQEKNTLYLYRLFVELVRKAWSSNNPFMDGGTRQSIRWDPDNNTDLSIGAEYMFGSTHKEIPCLIGIKLGELRYSKIKGSDLDNRLITTDDLGKKLYGRLAEGSVTLSHLALEPAQAIDMADGTQEFFTVFAPVIRSAYGFITLDVVSRVALAGVQPSEIYGKSRYSSLITLGLTFETNWYLNRESPKLRELFYTSGLEPTERYTIIDNKR